MGGIFGQLNLDAAQLGIAGIRTSNSIKHFGRRLKLQFPVSSDGFVRRPPTGTFNPCQGADLKVAEVPVTCGVAPDGSGIEIELNP